MATATTAHKEASAKGHLRAQDVVGGKHLSSAIWLLYLLLATDLFFVLLDLLNAFTDFLQDSAFSLDTEGGYGELFQYLKLFGLAIFFAIVARVKRAPVYVSWALLFGFLFLDDALQIHERLGAWIADWSATQDWSLPVLFHMRVRDVGELLVAGFIGLFFLTALTATYQRSDRPARSLSQFLLLMLAFLAFFGVIVDAIHEMTASSALWELLALLEDGGELVVVSAITWYVIGRLEAWNVRTLPRWNVLALEGGVLFLLFLLLLARVQGGTPALVGHDGYYHAKMGLLIREQGLKPPPPQLPLTILNEASFSNHHFLYHLYLSLFTTTDPSLDGGLGLTRQAKAASVLLPALAFMAVWWLLCGQRVPAAALWAAGLLALSEAFLYRMSMPRVQAASLLVLVVGLHWLLQRRYRLLLPLSFAYVWLYDGFPLLLALAGCYVVAAWLLERQFPWPALAYPALGMLLGLVIHPYFPQNIAFLARHLSPKVGELTTPVGSEWYPYDTWQLVENSGFALAAFLLGTLFLGWREKRFDKATLTAFLMTALLGLMLFKSRRFVEYFPPFVLIFTAFSAAPVLREWQAASSRQQVASSRWQVAGRNALLAAGYMLLVGALIITVQAARASVARSLPANQYSAAALWLRAYAEPDSRIFQTDWDDFPRLFFYDSDKVYTIGLDPTYMQLYDPALYDEWVSITRGEVAAPSAVIRDRFAGDFVFSDLYHEAFLQQAAADSGLEEIYRDEYAVIFEVKE